MQTSGICHSIAAHKHVLRCCNKFHLKILAGVYLSAFIIYTILSSLMWEEMLFVDISPA
jgi:hypothetical protein